jgi:hypothetical protein
MKKKLFNLVSFFILSLLSVFCFSCSGYKQNKYVNQIKKHLPVYDSINSSLIAKYSNSPWINSTIIYPSKTERQEYLRIFDASINNFCSENDISYIEIERNVQLSVTYFLSDNNYQHIFDNKGTHHKEIFENMRVRIVPINDKWTF